MARNSTYTHVYGDSASSISTAVLGATAPTLPAPALGAGWYDLGWIDDGAVTENQTYQETNHYGWQGGLLVRKVRYQPERSFDFQCLEENAVTLGLLRRNAPVITAGTNAVQTVTITGAPTGGTFTLTYAGLTTGTIVWNAAAGVVQTALQALGNIGSGQVAVTGGPGPATPWIVTFTGTLGSQVIALMTANGSLLTGGAPVIAVANTTPGVVGTNNWAVNAATTSNIRQFSIDMTDGLVKKRYYIPTGEVNPTGTIVYQAKDITVYNFHLECYADASGNFYYDLNSNPAQAGVYV